jgi:hypothetical protein
MLLNRFPSFAPIHFLMEEVLRGRAVSHRGREHELGRAVRARARVHAAAPVSVLATLPFEMVLLREAGRELGFDVAESAPTKAVISAAPCCRPRSSAGSRTSGRCGSSRSTARTRPCCSGSAARRAAAPRDRPLRAELLDPTTMAPVTGGVPGVSP